MVAVLSKYYHPHRQGKHLISNPILSETVTYIADFRDLSSLYIDDLHVTSPFSVVRLSDGFCGSACNYHVQNRIPGFDSKATRAALLRCVRSDPLLLETLQPEKSLLELSVLVAIISALSQPLFEATPPVGRDFDIALLTDPHTWVCGLIRPRDRVAVVGYGGPVSYLWNDERIARLDIFDTLISQEGFALLIEEEVKALCHRHEDVKLHARADDQILGVADICVITASALCNNSLEHLMSLCTSARELIVQGPSASIVPMSLFRRGCTTLLTTKKNDEEFMAGMQESEVIYDYVDRFYHKLSPRRARGTVSAED